MAKTGDFRGVLLRIGQSMGMTEAQFDACVGDEKALKALNARLEKASENQIRSTPTFQINGKTVKEGEMTMAELDAAVAAASK
jgi:predicted DsbA family dithiol-disulfide isomerase